MSETHPTRSFAALEGRLYMSLTTFRKTGKAVATPVCFADEGGKLYVSTRDPSGKVKRIRNNPRVLVAPCTMRDRVTGPAVEAVARIMKDGESALARQALLRAYGWRLRLSNFFQKFRRERRVFLEIRPA